MTQTTIDFKEIYKRKIKECINPKNYNTGCEHLKNLIEAYEAEKEAEADKYRELVKVTKKMRELQTNYFKTRSKETLKLSMQYEQLCDKVLYLINDIKY